MKTLSPRTLREIRAALIHGTSEPSSGRVNVWVTEIDRVLSANVRRGKALRARTDPKRQPLASAVQGSLLAPGDPGGRMTFGSLFDFRACPTCTRLVKAGETCLDCAPLESVEYATARRDGGGLAFGKAKPSYGGSP